MAGDRICLQPRRRALRLGVRPACSGSTRGLEPPRSPLRRQDGSALIVVLLLVAVMLALGAFGSRGGQIELRIAHNELVTKQALDTAEAGLYHAFNVLRTDVDGYNSELSSGGTGGVLASIGSVVALDGTSYRFRAFGGGTSDGYYVRVADNFDETSGADNPTTDKDGRIRIISRGRVGGAERVIEALLSGGS